MITWWVWLIINISHKITTQYTNNSAHFYDSDLIKISHVSWYFKISSIVRMAMSRDMFILVLYSVHCGENKFQGIQKWFVKMFSFYIPWYKRWRGETFLFKLPSYLFCLLFFFSSACKQKQIVLNRHQENSNHLIHVRQILLNIRICTGPLNILIPLITGTFVDYDNTCI